MKIDNKEYLITFLSANPDPFLLINSDWGYANAAKRRFKQENMSNIWHLLQK